MVLFYDPVNDEDLTRIETLLHRGGIEYFLRREPEPRLGKLQIYVAEEDVPAAQALVENRS